MSDGTKSIRIVTTDEALLASASYSLSTASAMLAESTSLPSIDRLGGTRASTKR